MDDTLRDTLRAQFEAMDGVRHAFVNGPPLQVFLICDGAGADESSPELSARALLTRNGFPASDAELHLSYLAPPEARRRVRLVGVEMERPRIGRALATVELEWGGTVHREQAEGDAGPAAELRLVATATLRSLERVLGGALAFELVGIRSLHAFDNDLMVVLTRPRQTPRQSLVGVALVPENPIRSASLAVLNATNRILGNYLNAAEGER